MEERVTRLHGQLQRIQQVQQTMSPGAKDVHAQCSVLNSINEDLHWLILVAGKSSFFWSVWHKNFIFSVVVKSWPFLGQVWVSRSLDQGHLIENANFATWTSV